MKNMKTVVLAVLLGVLGAVAVYAATGVRGAKGIRTINASATAVLVCPNDGVVYSVLVSTGAVTDFVVLRDTGTANTTSAQAAMVAPVTALSTQMTFDPPLQFVNGISLNAPAAILSATVVYECGRVINGY